MLGLKEILQNNSYPGRGIIVGLNSKRTRMFIAYFIMGRSVSSRSRIFVEKDNEVSILSTSNGVHDDASLVIYNPVKNLGQDVIVANGDQSEDIYNGLKQGYNLAKALENRKFEPDWPHYTPRISLVVHPIKDQLRYELSIIKTEQGDPNCCCRFNYVYDNPQPGQGRFIHTYKGDKPILESYEGEPTLVKIDDYDVKTFAQYLWDSLNEDNKISLFVRAIDVETNTFEDQIINKYNK